MIRHRRLEAALRCAAIAFIVSAVAAQIVTCRGLYADGASVLVSMLDGGGFWVWDPPRLSSQFFLQIPTALALKAGATNLVFLRYLYSGWLFVAPLCLWLLAFYELRKQFLFWPFVILFALVPYNVGFFAAGEYNLCAAATACCLACLLHRGEARGFDRTVLVLAAALLPFSYPVSLFTGGLLLVLASVKLRRAAGLRGKFYWVMLCLLFALAAASGLWEVLVPRHPDNFAAARETSVLLYDDQLVITLAFGALASLGFFVPWRYGRAVLLAVALFLMIWFVRLWIPVHPTAQYNVRLYVLLLFFAAAAGLSWFARRGYRLLRSRLKSYDPLRHYILPVFTLFAVLAAFDIGYSIEYADYIRDFAASVDAGTGLIAFEDWPMNHTRGNRLFGWSWTYPSVSLLLRSGTDKAIILNPRWFHGYQPFNPHEHVPDLSRYYGAP